MFKKFQLTNHTDARFSLTPVELKDFVDFEVKRVYYITDFHQPTGSHCHKIEKEFFICEQGEITAIIDAGNGLEEHRLKKDEAIYVDSYVWHHFKDAVSGTVLLALSSTNYNPNRSDYLENYEDFKKVVYAKK